MKRWMLIATLFAIMGVSACNQGNDTGAPQEGAATPEGEPMQEPGRQE